MKNDLLMLSLPNSGSMWLCDVLAHTMPLRHCPDYEFFHPLRNEKHELELVKHFGCELASCYGKIVDPGGHDVIRSTWAQEDYNFTKEIFSPFKLQTFVEVGFRCFVFLRWEADSFPPSRLRVWSFYEHAWAALANRGWTLSAETARTRALEAHTVLRHQMLVDAKRLRVPVLWYHELMGERGAAEKALGRALGGVTSQTVEHLLSTRIFSPRGDTLRPHRHPSAQVRGSA